MDNTDRGLSDKEENCYILLRTRLDEYVQKLDKSHKYYNEIKELYSNLSEDISEAIKNKESKGKSKFDIGHPFERKLREFLKSYAQNGGFSVSEDRNVTFKEKYENLFKGIREKSAEMILKTKSGKTIIIEAKSLLNFDFLGAAYLEALVSKYDHFFIFSLLIEGGNREVSSERYALFKQILKEDSEKRIHIIIFDPNIAGFEEGITHFFEILNGKNNFQ